MDLNVTLYMTCLCVGTLHWQVLRIIRKLDLCQRARAMIISGVAFTHRIYVKELEISGTLRGGG